MAVRKQPSQPALVAGDLLPKAKMVNPRPTEVKTVAALLQEPADDVTALAKRVIAALDQLRFGKRTYGVIAELQGGTGARFTVYGPYPTVKSAQTAQAIVENVFPGRTRVGTISNTLSLDECPSSYYA